MRARVIDSPASLLEHLTEQERRFWEAGPDADHYREHLAEVAVMVFPAPFGILNRKAAIDAAAAGLPWERFELHEPAAFELAEGVGALVYRVSATRIDGSSYVAYVSSTYVHRDGAWKLAVHQQTPI
jgi:hypothetical protein